MSFGASAWFWAFLTLPLLVALYVWAEGRSARQLRDFVSPRLLPSLSGNVDRLRRALRFALILLALGFAVIALAQPRFGYTYEDVKRRGLDLLFAVDTSRSMLSNDVAPTRLARVKLAAQDLISQLEGDRVGLLAFAGRAFVQAPLTIDYGAAVEAINDLDTKTIPEGGTNISEAIALATQTFGKSAQGNRALIIFTDGEELSGDAVNTAKAAAENGVRIFTIGVGTSAGSLIPVSGEEGGFVKDAKGQVVKSKLDEARLREIAQATGGIYLHLENGPATMKQLYQEGLSKMKAGEFDARLSRRPIERYEWPLGAAILSLLGSIFVSDRKRRTRTAVAGTRLAPVAALLFLTATAHANSPGIDSYQQQKYEEALKQFQGVLTQHPRTEAAPKLEFDSGAAAYKLKDYDKALQSFSQALLSPDTFLQSKGHYNLGNTLYRRGENKKSDEEKLTDWNGALKHYEETLKLDPPKKEAKENYEFVKNKIDELKNKKQQQPSPSPSPTPPQQNKKDSEKNKDQSQQNKNDQPQDQNQPQKEQQDRQQQNQQNQKNDQQAQDQKQQPQQDQKSSNDKQSDEPQKSGEKTDREPKQPSPTPAPTPSPTPPPSASAQPTSSAEQSPSSTPRGDQSPSPSPGSSGSPSPAPGGENEGDASPSPAASGSPAKPKSGEIKGAGEGGEKKKEEEAAAVAEKEAEKRGEMTPRQAAQLLQAMKDEEARVQLDERRAKRRVYNDW